MLVAPARSAWNAMFTPLMASAAGYAATAYFYNLGRFKFDAEQRQDCIYQIQNMRLVACFESNHWFETLLQKLAWVDEVFVGNLKIMTWGNYMAQLHPLENPSTIYFLAVQPSFFFISTTCSLNCLISRSCKFNGFPRGEGIRKTFQWMQVWIQTNKSIVDLVKPPKKRFISSWLRRLFHA